MKGGCGRSKPSLTIRILLGLLALSCVFTTHAMELGVASRERVP